MKIGANKTDRTMDSMMYSGIWDPFSFVGERLNVWSGFFVVIACLEGILDTVGLTTSGC